MVLLGGLMACGPGVRLGPHSENVPPVFSGVFFTTKSALSTAWNGGATGSENLWYILSDGSGYRPMTQNSNFSLGSLAPSVSPDGARVVFHSLSALDGQWNGAAAGSYNIWIMNADGTGLQPITRNEDASLHSRAPVFSPDCEKIAFSSTTALAGGWNGTRSESANIWVANRSGTGLAPLTENETVSGLGSNTPVFSPDGTKIAFASSMDIAGGWDGTRASMNIWIMNADGSNQVALTRNTDFLSDLNSQRPVFTPDGAKIVFSSTMALIGAWNGTSAGTENIWIMNVDGSELTPLTRNDSVVAPSSNVDVSPDGTRIVFQSMMSLSGAWNAAPAAAENIWIMNLDGSGLEPLTSMNLASSPSTFPVFTGDGSQIVFWSKGNLDGAMGVTTASENLWVMNVDGSGKMPLTKNTGAGYTGTVGAPAVFKSGGCLP